MPKNKSSKNTKEHLSMLNLEIRTPNKKPRSFLKKQGLVFDHSTVLPFIGCG